MCIRDSDVTVWFGVIVILFPLYKDNPDSCLNVGDRSGIHNLQQWKQRTLHRREIHMVTNLKNGYQPDDGSFPSAATTNMGTTKRRTQMGD